MYSSLVKEHAVNPKNRREMESPDAMGRATYSRCGDKLTMFFQLQGDRIQESTFTARACGPVIAVASYATTILKGMSVEEALQLSALQMNEILGGLPLAKRHAFLIVLECLHEALSVFRPEDPINS